MTRPLALAPLATAPHRGPDGKGRNRFRLEYTEPRVRCTQRPSDPVSIWTLENRPHHVQHGNFGSCLASACEGCTFAQAPLVHLAQPARVTEDEQGAVTLHSADPDTFSGWGQFYRQVACQLRGPVRDASGYDWWAYPVPYYAEC